MRRPGIKPGSRPWQGRILSLYYRRRNVSVPRIELGISRVLGERHDQLDHTDENNRRNQNELAVSARQFHDQLLKALRASIAQLAEHALSKRKVAGSILAGGF